MMKVPCEEVNAKFAEKSMGDVPQEVVPVSEIHACGTGDLLA